MDPAPNQQAMVAAASAMSAQYLPFAFHPLHLFNQAYGTIGSYFPYPTAVNNFGHFLWRKKRSIKSIFGKQ